jgi:hypothetical protein
MCQLRAFTLPKLRRAVGLYLSLQNEAFTIHCRRPYTESVGIPQEPPPYLLIYFKDISRGGFRGIPTLS